MTSSRRQVRTSAATVAFAITLAACASSEVPDENVGATSSALTPVVGCDDESSAPSVATLQSGGYKFVGRFFNGDPKTTLSASELKPLMSVGIDVVLGWEGSNAEAKSLTVANGVADGAADARNALNQATALGVPQNRPIYFAINIDPTAAQLPAIEEYLHYRSVDVSTVKELARRWYPQVMKAAPTKAGGHRAMDDIRESVAELAYYRSHIFKDAAPG